MTKQPSRRLFLGRCAGTLGLAALAGRAHGADEAPSADAAIGRAVAFLRDRQEPGGGWSTARKEPGITALVVAALLRSGRATASDPAVTKGLGVLEPLVGPKGGLEVGHANYSTAIALMAFHEANKDGRYDRIVKGGQGFLKSMQWDESEGKGRDDAFYGGAGYGGNNSRPDLSNTAFMVEALRDSGLPADDPALQKALVFVSRCQNLQSEFNDQPWAGKVNDGGFIYTAANGGQSMAGPPDANGGLASYGSMTYAGFKSLVYAGLTKDDPRVKAALGYIRKHYTVDENPGMGQKGLYYYYQAFAKALSVLGAPSIEDADGRKHDWRAELTAALAKRQAANGSWVNEADRFMEGDPNLVTAYGLLALSYARAKG